MNRLEQTMFDVEQALRSWEHPPDEPYQPEEQECDLDAPDEDAIA